MDKTAWVRRLVDEGAPGVSKLSRVSRFFGLSNLVLVGAELSRDARNVAAFEVAAFEIEAG